MRLSFRGKDCGQGGWNENVSEDGRSSCRALLLEFRSLDKSGGAFRWHDDCKSAGMSQLGIREKPQMTRSIFIGELTENQ